jgi:O-antigen ligase
VAPLYLLACLFLGGSAQGIWQNAALQLGGIAILAWAIAEKPDEPLPNTAKPLFILAAAVVAYVALQTVPLPPALWAHGGRARVADGFELLGQPMPALPISVTPYGSLNALLGIIPPLAMLVAILRLRAYRPSWLAAALLAGAIPGVMLCALQVASPVPTWYLYRETNFGFGVGFFANANHMATLLLMALPFIAAIGAAGKTRNIQRYSALLTILAGIALVLIVGIALNGSLAGYALAVPVVAASGLIILAGSNRSRAVLAGIAALSVAGSVVVLSSSSIGGTKFGQEVTSSVDSRQQIFVTTSKAIADFMPLGSGLGSFRKVYRLHESPDAVGSEYVVHAHNDYAEIALEFGVVGIILMLLFLAWWAVAVRAVWLGGEGGPFTRAASIASAAVLVHSLVDFPLRTAAISACFAMCLALLADRRVAQRQEATDLRPARHLVVG